MRSKVFVTGRSTGTSSGFAGADELALSPNGTTVFVTGPSRGTTSDDDFATVAYNTTTGTQLWAKRYSRYGSGDYYEAGLAMAVSPAGNRVVVTGTGGPITPGATGGGYTTIAYNPATGAQQWVKSYNGQAIPAERQGHRQAGDDLPWAVHGPGRTPPFQRHVQAAVRAYCPQGLRQEQAVGLGDDSGAVSGTMILGLRAVSCIRKVPFGLVRTGL